MNSLNRQFGIANALVRAVVVALIVLAGGRASEARHSDSVPVFHCTFGDDWDVNYDGWPDRWIRKSGPDYPHYVNIAIRDDEGAVGDKCLTIDLDGAAAAIVSPPIHVMSRFSYVFEAQLKTEELKESSVVITLDFCDAAGHVVQTARTETFTNTNGWQPVRLGPVEPRDPGVDHVVLSLQVNRGNRGDLQGRVSLADVWLERGSMYRRTIHVMCTPISMASRCNVRSPAFASAIRRFIFNCSMGLITSCRAKSFV
jgi:hypothetical protein